MFFFYIKIFNLDVFYKLECDVPLEVAIGRAGPGWAGPGRAGPGRAGPGGAGLGQQWAGPKPGRVKIGPVFSGQHFNSPARPKNRVDRAK